MSDSEQTITSYLLGEVSAAERSALEERYFADPQLFERILQAESDLVDGYVRGHLSNETRERFELYYMAHPSRRARVEFAATLATRIDQAEESIAQPVQTTNLDSVQSTQSLWQRFLQSLHGQSLALRYSLALATLLIMLVGVWTVLENRRRQNESAQMRAAEEAQQRRERETAPQVVEDKSARTEDLADGQPRVESSPQRTPQPTPTLTPTRTPAPRVASLALAIGGVRGGDNGSTIKTLVISPDTTEARLTLNLDASDYPRYRATLQTVAGTEIFNRTNIKPARTKNGASFGFTLPARALTSGDYILTLSGVNSDGEVDALGKSLFRVDKR